MRMRMRMSDIKARFLEGKIDMYQAVTELTRLGKSDAEATRIVSSWDAAALDAWGRELSAKGEKK